MNPKQSPIRRSLRRTNALTILLVFGLFLMGTIVMMSILTRSLTSEFAELHSKELKAAVESELRAEVLISYNLARNSEIIDWYKAEEDLEAKEAAKQVFADFRDLFKDGNIFVAVNESLNYYHINEIYGLAMEPLGTLSPSNLTDDWYFIIEELVDDYDLNVDQDRFSGDYRLWINVPVYDEEGHYLGAIGTGLYLGNVLERLYGRESHDEVETLIVNSHGDIELAKDVTMITPNSFVDNPMLGKNIRTFLSEQEDLDFLADYFEEAHHEQVLIHRLEDTNYTYISLSPVAIGDWTVISFFDEREWFNLWTVLPLLGLMALLGVLLLIIVDNRTHKRVLRPYETLIQDLVNQEFESATYQEDMQNELGDSYAMIQSYVNQLTERSKVLESQMTLSRERLDRFYNSLSFGVFITDETFHLKYINDYMVQLLRIRKTDPLAFLNQQKGSFIYEPDQKKINFLKINEHQSIVEDLRLVTTDQESIWVHLELHAIDEGDHQLYEVIVINIQLRKAYEEQLLRLTRMDELTGLYNRRYFNEVLAQEIEEVNRYNYPLSMILYDIDKFKSINDLYGHDVGDQMLVELSGVIKEQLRINDVLARWGGEEFAIVLPHTDEKNAVSVAQKLRQEVQEHIFLDKHKITVSFGVTYYKPGEAAHSFFRRADNALYKAKNFGRNRVETFTSSLELYDFEAILSDSSRQSNVELIDKEHMALFEMVSQMILQINGEGVEQVITMEDLMAMVEEHFLHEEAYLLEEAYPDYAEHQRTHQKILADLKETQKGVRDKMVSLHEFLAFIIEDVLMDHLVHEDRKYMYYLKQKRKESGS